MNPYHPAEQSARVERSGGEMARAKIINDIEGVVRQALTDRIFRSPANTLTGDLAGLAGTSSDPGAWIGTSSLDVPPVCVPCYTPSPPRR